MQQLSLFDEQKSAYNTVTEVCKLLNVKVNSSRWPDKFGIKLHEYLTKSDQSPIRTLSLFSGAGGLDIGFRDLGFDIIESVEIEKKFCDTLKLNSGYGNFFAHSKVNCIDIREYTGKNLGHIDFIIGGPPCQTFSAAGRRASGVLGTNDARGVLFREYVRLLGQLKPKGFLFENVYGIIGAQGGGAWHEIVESFKAAGYLLYYRIVDAADYGVPQHRERLIIVGLRCGVFKFPRPLFGPDSIDKQDFYNAGSAIKDLKLTTEESKSGLTGRYGKLLDDIPPGLNYSFYTSEMGHPQPVFSWRSKFSDFLYKADPDLPVRTIKAQGGQYTGPLHWDNRYFSFSEYKRLQTFPDDYKISGSKQTAVKQIGNSVPPQLSRVLALSIREQVFGTVFPFKIEYVKSNVEFSFRKRKKNLTDYYKRKAKESIRELKYEKPLIIADKHFYVSISDKFAYTASDADGDYAVEIKWNGSLIIHVNGTKEDNKGTVLIEIRPKSVWILPVPFVKLIVHCSNWHAVTAAWKVLDKELYVNALKSDLVQLNGYYQYDSQLVCRLSVKNLEGENVMRPIIEGCATGKNIKTRDLADLWNIEPEQILTEAQNLKISGYEIRNKNTNPQMEEDEWLIPYKFPTLLPVSVQTYKNL